MELLAVPDAGSPKFQFHPLMLPVVLLTLWSVKLTAVPWQAAPWAKAAVGLGRMVTTRVSWLVQLSLVFTVRVTLNVPALAYWCVTEGVAGNRIFWVVPSPKSQLQRATYPEAVVLKSEKLTASPWQVGVLNPKLASGNGAMSTGLERVLLQPAVSVTVRVTVYIPAEVYECSGACRLEYPPSPKVQYQPEMLFTATPAGANSAGLPAQALWAVKSTAGLGFIVRVLLTVSEQLFAVKVISFTV